MRQLWTQASTTFHGRFFDVTDVPMVAHEAVHPTILIGGGGPKVMDLGGRVADIVSMIPTQDSGDWSVTASLADTTVERMAEKASWVRRGADAVDRDGGGVESTPWWPARSSVTTSGPPWTGSRPRRVFPPRH